MRRQIAIRKPLNLSLFPFLAVLICTMGSLIVLLVIVMLQAKLSADDQFSSKQADEEQLQLERADHEWRQDILLQERKRRTEQLSERRLQLSHLENHLDRLQEKWRQLQAQAKHLEQLDLTDQQDQSAANEELAQMLANIEDAKRELEKERLEEAQRKRSFTIVPYDGPNGTKRRPIYIECTSQGIFLQPEGVVLNANDFKGPLGPGNPLDASLRATREYLAQAYGDKRSGEPYPLLIVRPGGTLAYAMARAAMKSWDDEFGYELVDAEMELKYPAADPQLAKILEKTVKDARQRQRLLAQAMPSRFQQNGDVGFVAEGLRGGFTPQGEAGSESEGFGPEQQGFGFKPNPQKIARDEQLQAGRPDQENGNKQSEPGNVGSNGGGAAVDSLAKTKGKNWGLPNVSSSASPISRPIRVSCTLDQLILHPSSYDAQRSVAIPFRGSTRSAVEPFVSAAWDHMESWGIAVAGGYWKPVLHIEVAPNAQRRFAELEILLRDSGIEVKRK